MLASSARTLPSNRPMSFRRRPVRLLVWLIAVLAAVPIRADDADDRFAVASGHYAQQRWKLAAEEFQAFLKKYPRHPEADQGVFFLAEALLQRGDYDRAGTHFRQYLSRVSSGKYVRPALFRAGEAAYLAGKSELAKAELKQFQSTYPNDKLNAYVWPYLGDIALGESDVAGAARYFRAGLTQFPQGRLQDDCRFGLARALERQGRNEEAEQLYRTVAARRDNPLADDAQCHLGILQYATGQYARAVDTFAVFETTLAGSSWQSNARLGRGWALRKLGRLDEAQSVLAEITSDPKVGVDARYWVGIIQRTEKDWAAAAESLRGAAEAAGPDHQLVDDARFHAADSLLRAGKPLAARQQFDRVIASNTPGNAWIDDAMYGKVRAALELNDHDAVERTAAEFDRRFPESSLNSDVHRILARSLLQREEHAGAAKLIEPLVAPNILDRQGMEDRYLLALAYQGMQRYEEALPLISAVLASDAIDARLKADAQLAQGTLEVAMGRYSEAVKPLEAFLASNPTDDAAAKGRGELAICYARTGRLDPAKRLYAELLQKHPGHRLIAPTTEQLAEAAYEAEDTQWAAQLFQRLQAEGDSDQHSLKGLAGLAWSQLKAGRLDESAVTFGKLLEKDPPPEMAAEAALVRGQILARLERTDPALAMYDLVIDNYPETPQHPKAMLAAARLRDTLQQDRESAALYQRLAKEYSQRTELDTVLYEWAWVLDDLGKTAESSDLFERLRKQHPQSRYWADATYRLAHRAYATKDYARASQLTSELLAGKPDARLREDALDLRGHLAVATGDWEQVDEAFAALVREFPESPKRLVAEYYIADAAYIRKDYERAAREFERLARQTRGRQEAWLAIIPLRRAQALAQLNRWDEACAVASKIETEYPDFPQQYEVDYLIGRCLAAGAELQRARDAYQKVIRSSAGAKTETAAMAQLMIAETFWHQKSYAAALREYLRVEILYAYPDWQSLALLQAGKCHEKLGEWKQAAELYARLLKVYPHTDSARGASRRLRSPPEKQPAAEQPD